MITHITPAYIKNLVEVMTKLKIGNKSRKREYVFARNVYYQLCFEFCGSESYRAIGEIIGGKNHATVMHGIEMFDILKDQSVFYNYKSHYDNAHRLITDIIKGNLKEDSTNPYGKYDSLYKSIKNIEALSLSSFGKIPYKVQSSIIKLEQSLIDEINVEYDKVIY